MSDCPITIQVDNRIRLLSTILAATTWPVEEQARHPHGVHAHAKATRVHVVKAEDHAAVQTMQELKERGLSLDDIFSYATCLNWPGLRARGTDLPDWAPKEWSAQIRDFMHSHRIRELWEQDEQTWEDAEAQAGRALAKGEPRELLERFFGPLELELAFQPNLCFPTNETLGFHAEKKIVCVCPPRVAWGNNPPWPYDDDPAATYAEAIGTYAKVILKEYLEQHPKETEQAKSGQLPVPNTFRARYPEWFDQFAVIFVSGVTAIFLEEAFGKAESGAYIVMAHKAHGFKILPTAIDVLQRYLVGQAEGKYGEFADYMPTFSKTLRVAERVKHL